MDEIVFVPFEYTIIDKAFIPLTVSTDGNFLDNIVVVTEKNLFKEKEVDSLLHVVDLLLFLYSIIMKISTIAYKMNTFSAALDFPYTPYFAKTWFPMVATTSRLRIQVSVAISGL